MTVECPCPHTVAKATKICLVTYRNHCSELGDGTCKLIPNKLENYNSQQPHLPTTMAINLPATAGAASPKHRAEGMNQACTTDTPTCTIGWVSIRVHLHFPLPQDSGHGAVDYGIWRLTHPNKLPNPGLKYN